jgi:hypothetical protein
LYPASAAAAAAHERRLAWQILRTSWDEPERESDAEYFDRRAEEEQRTADKANGAARKAHQDLADLHRLVAEASRHRKPNLRFGTIERREAMLDDALDDSFPASDPPAFTAPAEASRWH